MNKKGELQQTHLSKSALVAQFWNERKKFLGYIRRYVHDHRIGKVSGFEPLGSGVWVQWPDKDRPYLHNRRFLTRVSRKPGQLRFEGWTAE